MLILASKDVKYCFVSSQKQGEQTATLPGLAYRGHLFIRVKSYQKNQLDKAIVKCREFLDLEIPVLCLIVKEASGFSLWYEDSSLKIVKNLSVASQQDNSKGNKLNPQNHSAKNASGVTSIGEKQTKATRKTVIPFFSGIKRS